MKAQLLGKLILFFSVAALVLSASVTHATEDNIVSVPSTYTDNIEIDTNAGDLLIEDMKDVVERFAQPEDMKDVVERFAQPSAKDIEAAEAIKTRSDRVAESQVLPSVAEEKQKPPRATCDFKVSYLISLSMPNDTVENVVREAMRINEECGKNVVSVGIRGFIGGDMKKTLGVLYRLAKGIRAHMPVRILHKMFREYDVKEVPYIIVKTKNGVKTVRGDVSIDYAVETARDKETAGEVYTPIIEEDFGDMINRRSAVVMKKYGERQWKITASVTRYEGRFKKAEKDVVYYVDPVYTAPEDIKNSKGAVLISRGEAINPADYVPLLGKYIVINGKNEEEVEFAKKIKPKAIIIISGDAVELSKKHRTRFFVADDLIVYGLELTRTPSIIEQEGKYIRVTEKKL